jgi:hypothetical protein
MLDILTPEQDAHFTSRLSYPEVLQTRWFATSGTGSRFGNPSDIGSI